MGTEHPYEKRSGRTRVVMLGDSIAYSAGVDDDRTFSALLERRRPDLEVVNLAVGGYGTDQELIKLEQEGLRYHPDVVVLHFCLFSDYTDNSLPSALFDARQPKPYFTWDGRALTKHDEHLKLTPPRKLAQWLSDYSHLYNRLRGLVGPRRAARQPGVWAERKNKVEDDLGPAAELTFALVRRVSELTQKAGARFYVVVHPDEFAFRHRSRLLRKLCTSPMLEGITVVEMGDRHRAAGLDFARFALDEPGHLTERGHEVAADVLATLIAGTLPADWDYRASAHRASRRLAERTRLAPHLRAARAQCHSLSRGQTSASVKPRGRLQSRTAKCSCRIARGWPTVATSRTSSNHLAADSRLSPSTIRLSPV